MKKFTLLKQVILFALLLFIQSKMPSAVFMEKYSQ
jgi:hypothetical protein